MPSVLEIAEKIRKKGGRFYLVGGPVRDKVMGKKPKDLDYCVIGLTKQQFESAFPNAKLQGQTFPVYRLMIDNKMCEIAFARGEKKVAPGHKGFEIFTSCDITIEQDLIRRDLTINAMAQDVLNPEKITDPFGGQQDIESKIIRATSNAFSEDPLRVYRAARIAAQFEFTIEPKTLEMMKRLKDELSTLSSERVFAETKKAIDTNKPSIYFKILKELDLLDVHFDAIANLEKETFSHSLSIMDRLENCVDFQKFVGLIHHIEPEKIKEMGHKIKLPTNWIKVGIITAENIDIALNFYESDPAGIVSTLESLIKSNMLSTIQQIASLHGKDYPISALGEQMLKINNDSLKFEALKGKEIGSAIRDERIAWISKYKDTKS
jgi:tRNA nucleotidyltransferase (CCA-adding enzyme)